MRKLTEWVGNGFGILGIALCVVAGVARLIGNWYVMGFECMVMFNVGVGLMVTACLAKLHVLSSR